MSIRWNENSMFICGQEKNGKTSSTRYRQLQMLREVTKQIFSQPSCFEREKNNIASTRNFNFLFSSINKLGRAAMFEKLCIVSFPESIEHLMN